MPGPMVAAIRGDVMGNSFGADIGVVFEATDGTTVTGNDDSASTRLMLDPVTSILSAFCGASAACCAYADCAAINDSAKPVATTICFLANVDPDR